MARLLHLSDLHFGADDSRPALLDGLVQAVGTQKADALLLTGDVFDSSTADARTIDGFLALYERLDVALGGRVPALILPGNHDRRDAGVFRPWSNALFETLARRLANRAHVRVLGGNTPFLGEVVEVPGIDADIVAYDSTYLPTGLVSAGGVVRQEDLLQVANELHGRDVTRPLLFLLHHHLVPTPVTDTSYIDTAHRSVLERFLVRKVLPNLVGNGDREELTMTALGAGTALATLHHLGRATLVLHGHKHYPTARLLKGVADDESDVLLVSAGSCGLATSWGGGDFDEAPRLWPSFNVIDLHERFVDISTVAWSHWDPERRNPPRALVAARQEAHRWHLAPAGGAQGTFAPVLAVNLARVGLTPSNAGVDRYDVQVQRTLTPTSLAYMPHYWEVVAAPPGARITQLTCAGEARDDVVPPARLKLPIDGESSYRILAGAVATVREAGVAYGEGTAFEWVGLVNRSRSAEATLAVDLGPVQTTPFGSATDLTTGKERPLPLERDGQTARLSVKQCPARTLLRVYWPLETR